MSDISYAGYDKSLMSLYIRTHATHLLLSIISRCLIQYHAYAADFIEIVVHFMSLDSAITKWLHRSNPVISDFIIYLIQQFEHFLSFDIYVRHKIQFFTQTKLLLLDYIHMFVRALLSNR